MRPIGLTIRALALLLVVLLAASPRAAEKTNDYAAVSALFAQHCLDCHATQEPEGRLVMETFESLMKGGESGAALAPGRSADSLLVKMIEGRFEKDGKKLIMPPGKRKKLQPEEVAVIKEWIDAGALPPKEPAKVVRELVLPKITPTVPPRRSIQALAFAPGPKLIAVARYGEVELMSSETRAVVRTLKGHRGSVNAVAFSADGKVLAAAAGEPALFGEVRLWNTADGALLRAVEGHKDALYAVAISPNGKTLATGSYDQRIKLWELETGKEGHTLSAHNGAIFDLAFRPDGKILASASADRTVKLWSVATGKRVETLSQPLKEQHALTWSPDGKRLASAGVDNRIRVWEVSDSAAETTNPLLVAKFAHEGAILNVLYSPDGKTLLSSAEDRTVKLWDAAQVTEKTSFETQTDVAPGLAFLGDGKSFVVGRLDGTVEFYDAEKGRRLPLPAPGLSGVEPRGVQRGLPVLLKLSGTNLAGITNVASSNPKLRVFDLTATNAHEARAMIETDVTLPRGAYEISVRGPGGESGRTKVFVDNLPQVSEEEGAPPSRPATPVSDPARSARDERAGSETGAPLQLPIGFWGTLDTSGGRDEIQFEARAGQTIVLELAVKTVGSKLANGALSLLDAHGAVLASDSGFDGGDRLLARTIPADGRYTARVTDQMLGASKDHFYRLSAGELPCVVGVFPMSVVTNAETDIELIGFNLPANARVRLKAGGAGEVEVPIDTEKFRPRRAFKVGVGDGPQRIETEPNDQPGQATTLPAPGVVNGRIWKEGLASSLSRTGAVRGNLEDDSGRNAAAEQSGTVWKPGRLSSDADLFRFEARASQAWILETDAARRGSPVDTKLEVLHANGRPVARMLLHAVRNTAINFRGVDSIATGMRLDHYEEMELNEYLYLNGEVMRLFRSPQGPDSEMLMYTSGGKRRAYFDTTAVAHALDEQGFIVEPQPLGAKFAATGLPVFTVSYENDDDGERQLGSDSKIHFTAPTNGSYLVRVTDTRGLGGDTFAYRLIARYAKPDFTVTLGGTNPTVSPGSGQSFAVNADRLDGFDGEIRVDINGLPPGFSVSTPITIEAGHAEAKGSIHAALDAPPPNETNGATTKVTATAKVNGKPVTKEVNGLGKIKLGGKPKLHVALEPHREGATNHFDPAMAPAQPLELTIAPGQTIPASLKIKRSGHEDLVTFFAENLPHGVIVADIGLNGVLIPKGESERQIFFSADKWVADQDRLFHMIEQQAGKQTSLPVLLKVRRASAKQSANGR
jgi:WD40 repeat protein